MVFTAVHQTIFKTTYDYDSAPKQFGILLNDVHVHTILIYNIICQLDKTLSLSRKIHALSLSSKILSYVY